MKAGCSDVYISMYHALDAAYDEDVRLAKEGILNFLTDADPFIWKDRRSADPVVYSEFREAFEKEFGDAEADADSARLFCREWLANQASRHEVYTGTLREAFDSVASPRRWMDVLGHVRSQSVLHPAPSRE